MEKRKLTDTELREWGYNLSDGQDWEGIDGSMVYRMMMDTAGNDYDVGEADWDFDKSDAERLLELMTDTRKEGEGETCPAPLCLACDELMHKSGFSWSGKKRVQRWRCNKCGRTTIRTPS